MDINIKDYDEVLDDNNNPIKQNEFSRRIGGHNDNSFVLCNGDIFYQLFDEIKYNPNCSYITYLNDFIKRYYDGESLPITNISCFKKEADYGFVEQAVSRLANELQIPTQYTIHIAGDSVKERAKKINELIRFGKPGDVVNINKGYLLSVDFISKNEKFDMMDSFIKKRNYNRYDSVAVNNDDALQTWFMKCVMCPDDDFVNPITNGNLSKDVREKLFGEFLPQYFFKKYIVKDKDVASRNFGIIYNTQNGEYKMSPMYDFEYSFHRYSNITEDMKENQVLNLRYELIFAYKLYPEIMENFITKVWDLYHGDILNSDWIAINGYRLNDDYKKFIVASLDDFVDAINTLQTTLDLD